MDADTALLKLPTESVTLDRLTVINCALVTPVRFTTYWDISLLIQLLLTVPTPFDTLTSSTLIKVLAKVKMIARRVKCQSFDAYLRSHISSPAILFHLLTRLAECRGVDSLGGGANAFSERPDNFGLYYDSLRECYRLKPLFA